MKRDRAFLAERLALIVGFVALVAAVVAVDWRAGLGLAGVLLMASGLDLRRQP